MILIKNSSNNGLNILSKLNDVIYSLSCKSDFHEIEAEFFKSLSSIIPAHASAIYLFNPLKYKPEYISGIGIDNDFVKYYEKRGRKIDPLKNWMLKNRMPYHSQLLLGLEGWQHNPV